MKEGATAGSGMATMLVVMVMVMVMGRVQRVESKNGFDISAMIIFGDSTMDVGNNNKLATVIRGDHFPYGMSFPAGKATGRFTDGKLPIDYIAEKLNLSYPLAYSDSRAKGSNLLDGINFASSGSGLIDSTANLFNVISFTKQLAWFDDYKTQLGKLVGEYQAGSIISKALYIVGSANNDFIYQKINPLVSSYSASQFSNLLLQKMATNLEAMYRKGARNMGVVSVAPLGCLPAEKAGAGRPLDPLCVDDLNRVVESFNSQLQDLLQSLQSKLIGARMVYLDSYSLIRDAALHPAKYGLAISRRSCCGTGVIESSITCNILSTSTCNNPSEYLFFDSYHPTTHMYKILADDFYNQTFHLWNVDT